MTLGEKLLLLRKEKGLTIRELAKIFQIGKTTVQNYEHDERKPDYEMIKKFAEFYDVSVDFLVGKSEDRVSIEVPQELREVGIEYITLAKEMEEEGLSPESIRELIEFAKKIKK